MIFAVMQILAQNKQVESQVYKWKEIQVNKNTPISKQLILQGATGDLKLLEAYAVSLFPGKKSLQTLTSDTSETMILIKEGVVEIELSGEQKTIGAGSMVLILPGDGYKVNNAGNTPATYYLLKFNARAASNKSRGISSGGSFVIDFSKLEFKPHDKGGIRNYYKSRPTAMFGFTEMHVTTLNPRIKSHDPHTHAAAEIVLMISGESEMQIGDAFYKGTTGDLYYLESNVSHAIRNTGDNPCMYFAIQWE